MWSGALGGRESLRSFPVLGMAEVEDRKLVCDVFESAWLLSALDRKGFNTIKTSLTCLGGTFVRSVNIPPLIHLSIRSEI
jgi:hypothetical protein